jgi:predicted adenine nucleotide alpha hydrolase (AANH) superfamily ATPase
MKEKLLVHVCCAPCFIAPYEHLKEEFEVYGFWYNHNIHPYLEYQKRHETWKQFANENNIKTIDKDEYKLEEFLQKASFREKERCNFCYYDRLKYAAIVAKNGNFQKFTTTLLYSKFQNHNLIRDIGNSLATEYGLEFFYQDFREYWKEGIELSKQKNMYRQQYCGCIYSEKERYLGKQ